MLNFLNDVRVLTPTVQGDLVRIQGASPVAGSSPDDPVASPKGRTLQVSRHHDDGDGPVSSVLIVGIVFTFIYLIVKAVVNSPYRRNRQIPPPMYNHGGGLTEEETAILQKLQRTLSQMESRVEALETILIDQSRTEKNYGSKF